MQSSESSIWVKVISHFTNVICLCAAAWVSCSNSNSSKPPTVYFDFNRTYKRLDIIVQTFCTRTSCPFASAILLPLNRKKSDVQTIPGQMGRCLHEEIEDISTLLAGSTRVLRRVTRPAGTKRRSQGTGHRAQVTGHRSQVIV